MDLNWSLYCCSSGSPPGVVWTAHALKGERGREREKESERERERERGGRRGKKERGEGMEGRESQ